MSSAGETLRRERLKRNLDLDQISHELKISGRLLDAIESDQYERLPGGVFAKAFVRQYATLLGLDAEELAGQVQRAMDPPSLQFDTPKSKPAVTPIDVPRVEEWTAVGDKRFRITGSLSAAALVVVAMLICSAVYAWMQRPKSAPVAQNNPVRTEASKPVTTPVSTPPAPAETALQAAAGAAVNTQPAVTAASTTPQPAAPAPVNPAVPPPTTAAPATPGPVHVEIVADEVAWVLARVDGKFAFSDTLEPNARRSLDGTKDVMVRLGNAGGVTITLNGKPIGPAGPKGQVRTIQFTSGGFQIVSAKPPDAPLSPLDR